MKLRQLCCVSTTTKTMVSSNASTRSAPFSIEEFNQLVSTALDFDPTPLPLLNFIPTRSRPDSLEWTANLDSYVDDEQDILALDHPLLSLHNLSQVDISPISSSSFFDRVKSRASSFVRRGAKHDVASSSPAPDDVSPTSFTSHLHVPRKSSAIRFRENTPPLNTQSSRNSNHATSLVSAPLILQRPSQSSRSLSDYPDNHYLFATIPSPTPTYPRRVELPFRTSKSQYQSHVEENTFKHIPPPLIQCTPPSRSPSPYICPHTPPLLTPPLTSTSFHGPSVDYLNMRRGSDASTSSSTSSMSVSSIASTLTSRLSTSLSFHKLASKPFSRSKSKLGLKFNTNVASSNPTPSASAPHFSPLTPSSLLAHESVNSSGYTDFASPTSFDKPAKNPVFVDRVLTPEADPFAKVDGLYARHSDDGYDHRSETPTIHSMPNVDNRLADYSFPSTSVSPFLHSTIPEHAGVRGPYIRKTSPDLSPSDARALLKFPADTKKLSRTHNGALNDYCLPDWTLYLPNSGGDSHTRIKRQRSAVDVLKPADERVRFSSTPTRPGSPFPFIGELSASVRTPSKSESSLVPTVRRRSESFSARSSSDLQIDEDWPLPPRRTVVVVVDSDSEDDLESVGNKESTERSRNLRQGWHDVEPSVEYYSPKKSPDLPSRRHSVRFPRRSSILGSGLHLLPPASAPGHVETFPSIQAPTWNLDDGPVLSPTSRSLNDQQLEAIAKTFGVKNSDEISLDSAELANSQARTSFESSASRFTHRTRSKTSDSSTSCMSFYSAKSRFSSLSSDAITEVVKSSVPYFGEGLEVIDSRGHWDFWLLGLDGFLDGQEDGALNILARSWNDLMEFCASHQRVVIGRNVPTTSGEDPVVLRVRLAELDEESGVDGIEMTLTLERVSRESAEKVATLLAFQLPTPTTFGELGRLCRKGLVGQGVYGHV